jgi:photosystem II stability/assembly factor-like uncharacterized protein
MLRRPRYVSALAVAACGLLAAACSAPAGTAPASTAPASTAPAGAAAPVQAPPTRTLTSGPTPQYTAVAFPRAATGWLLGQPSFGAARAEIWHSANAGRTFQPQWQGAGDPLALSATDPAHAWALIACPGSALKPDGASCGRTLIGTTDAGLHWRVIARLPTSVNQVQFFSGRLGVATSDRCLAVPSTTRCPSQLLVSRDGGAHWTPVLAAPGPVFATAAAAGRMWAAEPAGSVISFLASTDGGRHWRALGRMTSPGPLSPDVRVDLAAGPPGPSGSPGLAWASVFDELSCAMHGCATAFLLHSEDGGQSWNQVTLADSRSDQCGPGNIAFSAAPDASTWAATGRNGAACSPPLGLLYRSGPPGGNSVSQRSLPALPPWQLTQVTSLDAVNGEVAYAIGGQGLLARTGDGGLHWTELRPAPAPTGLLDVLGPATALGAQDAGDAGAILRSADGGRSWTELADLPGVVTQLDFPVATDGIAATYQAGAAPGTPTWRLWRSRDGGLTWQAAGALPGGNTDIFGPWFSASGHGLLLTVAAGIPWEPGSGGSPPIRVWTTADWGSSWSRGGLLPLGGDSLAGTVSFTPAGGLVPGVGWSGWLVVDTAAFAQHVAVADGGPLRLLPASPNVNNVQLLGHGTGFAWGLEDRGGSGRSILALSRTTDGGHSWRHSSTTLVSPPGAGYTPLLDFSDTSHGWLVFGGVTWRTSDGGINWT